MPTDYEMRKAEDLAETILLARKMDSLVTRQEMHNFLFTETHGNIEIINLAQDEIKEADEWFDKPVESIPFRERVDDMR